MPVMAQSFQKPNELVRITQKQQIAVHDISLPKKPFFAKKEVQCTKEATTGSLSQWHQLMEKGAITKSEKRK